MRVFVALVILATSCHHRRPPTPGEDGIRGHVEAPLPTDDGFHHPVDVRPPQLSLLAYVMEVTEPIWDASALPGAIVLSERGVGVLVVDSATGETLRNLGFPEAEQVASRDDLVVVGEDNVLHGVDAATGAVRWTASYEDHPWEVQLTPDGASVLVAVRNRVERRDAATGALRWAWTASPAQKDGDLDWVHTLDITPDGLTVITHDGAQVISLDAETGTRTRDIVQLGYTVFAVSLSPDGTLLVAGSMESEVVLIDFRAGKVLHRFSTPALAFDAAWSPDGRSFATLGLGGDLEVRDVDGKILMGAVLEGSIASGLLWADFGLLVWCEDEVSTWQ